MKLDLMYLVYFEASLTKLGNAPTDGLDVLPLLGDLNIFHHLTIPCLVCVCLFLLFIFYCE